MLFRLFIFYNFPSSEILILLFLFSFPMHSRQQLFKNIPVNLNKKKLWPKLGKSRTT